MAEKFTVNLPDIGEGVVEGEVIEWLKAVGDPLAQDEPVVVVMTDKATVELPAPYPGTLSKQHYAVGGIAIKDEPLYEIALSQGTAVAAKDKKVPKKSTKTAVIAQPKPEMASNSGKALATPAVRGLARDLGIDIGTVQGTGPAGRILKGDLAGSGGAAAPSRRSVRAGPLVASSTPVTRLEGDEEVPIVGFRNLTAEKMVESKYLIPHFSYFDQVDAGRLMQLKKNVAKQAAEEGIKLTFMPFFLKALSLTIESFPHINSSVDLATNTLVVHTQHNIGIAMSGPNGLVVPVLRNVQDMNIAEVIREFEALKQKALASKVEAADMKDSTITISNFGALGSGGVYATPIINYPETAILGVARIRKQPVVKNGEVIARDIMNTSWSFDHRVINGDMAAGVSHEFATTLANPGRLL